MGSYLLVCWYHGIISSPLHVSKKNFSSCKNIPLHLRARTLEPGLASAKCLQILLHKAEKNVGLAGWQFKGAAVSTIRHITTQVDQLTSKAKRFACFKAFYWPMVNSQAFLLVDDTNKLSSITLAQNGQFRVYTISRY